MEERPQQAARPPEAAAASAPPEARATEAQRTAGETQPSDARAAQAPTEQKSDAVAGAPATAEPEQAIGAATDQPDAIKSEAEETPSKPERKEAEAVAEPQAAASPAAPAEAPAPAEPGEEPQAVYDRVLQEQRDKGSSPQVAEARAKVARVKAERGLRASIAPARAAEPVPSVPQQTRPAEPEPSGAPEATAPEPEPGPVAPTETEDDGRGAGSDIRRDPTRPDRGGWRGPGGRLRARAGRGEGEGFVRRGGDGSCEGGEGPCPEGHEGAGRMIETWQQVVFWAFGVVMILMAVRVVTAQNVVHAALYLVGTLLGAASIYVMLLAEFVAWVQVLVYVGAIVVLMLFGLMLTRAPIGKANFDNEQRLIAALCALAVFGVTSWIMWDAFKDEKINFAAGGRYHHRQDR